MSLTREVAEKRGRADRRPLAPVRQIYKKLIDADIAINRFLQKDLCTLDT